MLPTKNSFTTVFKKRTPKNDKVILKLYIFSKRKIPTFYSGKKNLATFEKNDSI